LPRTDRLLRLLDALRSLRPPVTARALSARLEVTERTIYRDIAALRTAGARIDGEAGYGYTLDEDPALPPLGFERLEIEALVLGLSEVRMRGDEALAVAAETALAKITAALPEDRRLQVRHAVLDTYRYGPTPEAGMDLAPVRSACWEERALDITYADAEGRETARRIWPLGIFFLDHAIMVLAWCCLREDFRMFRVSRMRRIEVSTESFRPRRVAMLRDYLARLAARRGAAGPHGP